MRIGFAILIGLLLSGGGSLALAAEAGPPGPQVQARLLWEDPGGYTPVVLRLELPAGASEVQAVSRIGQARSIDRWQAPDGVSFRTMLIPPTVGESSRSGECIVDIGEVRRVRNAGPTLIGQDTGVVLVHPHTENLLDELRTQMNEAFDDRHGYGHRSRAGTTLLQQIDLLPDRWQAYPSWLSLFITPEGLAKLRRQQIEAIIAWTRVGGHVVLIDPEQDELDRWRKQGAQVQTLRRERVVSSSSALVRPRRTNRFHNPITSTVAGTDKVPVTGFMVLAVLFSLLVGPANLWWCIKTGRRHMLFVVTPVLSLGTCVLLLLYNIFAEGLDIKRLQSQLVMLDQQRHVAVSFTGATYFAPFGIGGFEADAETKVLPMNELDQETFERQHRHRSGNVAAAAGLELDWREGQQADGIWVPSRINRRLVYVQQRHMRDRLVLRRHGDGLALVNGLPVTIKDLLYRDVQDQVWEAQDCEPGQQVILRRTERDGLRLTKDGQPVQPADDLGAGARRWWSLANSQQTKSRGWCRCLLAEPIVPVLGPDATDPEPGHNFLISRLLPEVAP